MNETGVRPGGAVRSCGDTVFRSSCLERFSVVTEVLYTFTAITAPPQSVTIRMFNNVLIYFDESCTNIKLSEKLSKKQSAARVA